MVQRTLNKIEGTVYKRTLESHKKMRKHYLDNNFDLDASAEQKIIYGYVQALRDASVVTDRERQELFIYYGTM